MNAKEARELSRTEPLRYRVSWRYRIELWLLDRAIKNAVDRGRFGVTHHFTFGAVAKAISWEMEERGYCVILKSVVGGVYLEVDW